MNDIHCDYFDSICFTAMAMAMNLNCIKGTTVRFSGGVISAMERNKVRTQMVLTNVKFTPSPEENKQSIEPTSYP